MAVVEIILRTIDQGSGNTTKVTSGLAKLAAQYLSVGAVATTAAKALQFSVDQAAEAEKVNAQLAAVLQSTGGAAGMSAEELDKMATSLSRVSMVDDETIKRTEALMLTFTKVGREVFPEAIQATLDMSAALGQDLQSSTIQLGKALNDPIKGITALSRVGVSFTEEQKNMIKVLVESGDTLSAQKIILQELSTEFGGQALAASKTYTGQMSQLKNEVGNLGEAIGSDLLPELHALVTDTKDLTIWVTDNIDAIQKWGGVVVRAFSPLSGISDLIRSKWRELRNDTDATDEATESTNSFNGANQNLSEVMEGLTVDTKEQEAALKELTAVNQSEIATLERITGIIDAYKDQQADLKKEHDELVAKKAELIAQGWWAESDAVQEVNRDLEENARKQQENADEFQMATNRRILARAEELASIDGLTTEEKNALIERGIAMGVYTQEAAARMKEEEQAARDLASSLVAIPNVERTVTINHVNTYTDLINSGGPYSQSEKHAEGGMFEIPRSYGNEGFRMGGGDTASGGEKLAIAPEGKDFIDYSRMGRTIEKAFTRALNKAGG